MRRFFQVVIMLLIFSLLLPNVVWALDIRTNTEESEEREIKELPLKDDSDEKVEKTEVDESPVLSPEEIIAKSQVSQNSDKFLASSWDNDFLVDNKNQEQNDISKNFSTDLFTGAVQYNYNLDIPAGRNGMQPNLSFSYNHQLQNYNDFLPLGWSLNGWFYIQRDNRNGVDSLYKDNKFVFSGAGALEPYNLTDGIYGEYRLEVDEGQAWRFYFQKDNGWEVVNKNGVRYYFGQNLTATNYGGNLVSQWNIEKIEDSLGNKIVFSYFFKDGVSYLENIRYTDWQNEKGIYELNFSYQQRLEDYLVFNQGFSQNYNHYLKNVDVYVNGILRKRFDLEILDNGILFLNKFVKKFYDKNGNLDNENKIVEFEYNQINSNVWEQENWGAVNFSFLYPGDTQLLDINNDGFSDVVKANKVIYNSGYEVNEAKTWLNSQGSHLYEASPSWQLPISLYNYYENGYSFFNDVKFLDINGDSKIDILKQGESFINNSDDSGVHYVQNNNYIWWPHWFYDNNQPIEKASTADLNGDGLIDYVFNKSKKVYLSKWDNNKNTIVPDWLELPREILDYNNEATGVRLIDINKDGLDDLVESFNDQENNLWYKNVYLNLGNGNWKLLNKNAYTIPLAFNEKSSSGVVSDSKVFLFDINNDGYEDFIDAKNSNVYLFGKGGWSFIPNINYTLPQVLFDPMSGWKDFRWGEVDGKPALDLWYLQNISNQDYLFVYKNKSSYNNLLKKVTNETGASISLEYTTTALENNNEGPLTVLLKKVYLDDGFENKLFETYSYEGSNYFIDDIWQKGRNGFSKITKELFNGRKDTYYFHQGNGVNNPKESFDFNELRGKIYWHNIFDKNDNLLQSDFYNWEILNKNNFTFLALKDESNTYFNQGQVLSKSISYIYDEWQNLSKVYDLGETVVDFANREIHNKNISDDIYINYFYADDRKGFINSALKHLLLTDGYNKTLKQQKYYYDKLEFGAVNYGLLSKEEIQKNNSDWISKNYEYNKYGLLIKNTDFKNNAVFYKYDNYNLYPTSFTNALNMSTYYEYDYFCSDVLKETEANNIAVVKEFDNLCRLKNVYKNNLSTGESQHLQEISYKNTFPFSVSETKYLDETGKKEHSFSYYDGFLRKILNIKLKGPNFDSQGLLYKYDLNSNLIFKSEPFPAIADLWLSTYDPQEYTTFSYDSLGRLVEFNSNNDWAVINYNLLKRQIDFNGQQSEYEYNIRGNLTKVKNKNNNKFLTTSYEYDVLGRLNKYIDAQGNERNWQFDKVDNIIYNEDAHHPDDQTFIYWTYDWDDNSNLLKKTTWPDQTFLNYKYDSLNRVVSEDDSQTNFLDYQFNYDLSKNGLLKLSSVRGRNFEKSFSYNSFGNLLDLSYLIKNNNYNFQYFYNYWDYPVQVNYPDKSKLYYEYNNNGQLQSSWLIDENGKQQDIILDRQYNIDDSIKEESYGNGVKKLYTYNIRKNISQEQLVDVSTGQVIWQQDYDVNEHGNLLRMDIDTPYLNDNYYFTSNYNDLNAITEFNLYKNNNLVYNNYYTYDGVNNLLADRNYDYKYSSNNLSYANPYAVDIAVAKNGNVNKNYTYDKQGNVLNDSQDIYEWNANNDLIKKITSQGIFSYSYDDEHNRIYSEDQKGNWNLHLGPMHLTDKGDVDFYYNDFQIKKSAKGEINKIFNFYDRFDNLFLQLDDKKSLVNYFIYKPFGEIYLSYKNDRGSPYLFHNQYRDSNKLDYVYSRYYDYSAKRWLSLDAVYKELLFLDNSQLNKFLSKPYLINPYTYVANSPWRYRDEQGEWPETLLDLASIGFSFNSLLEDPSLSTTLFFMYDVGATLVPLLPASQTPKIASKLVQKASVNSARLAKNVRKLSRYLGKSFKNTMKLVKNVASQVSSKAWVSKLGKWSPGRIGNRIFNFAIHFVKHIDELLSFNIKNVDDYFDFSVQFLDNLGSNKVMTDLGQFYKLTDQGKDVFYNPLNKLFIVVGGKDGNKYISSFYKATDSKHNYLWRKLKDVLGWFMYHLLKIAKIKDVIFIK